MLTSDKRRLPHNIRRKKKQQYHIVLYGPHNWKPEEIDWMNRYTYFASPSTFPLHSHTPLHYINVHAFFHTDDIFSRK